MRGAKGEYPSWHQLEEAGLVSRHNYGTIPPKVDYSLTDDGEALLRKYSVNNMVFDSH